MNTDLKPTHNHDGGDDHLNVSFPVLRSQLGDFVSSLLGQKQTIERSQTASFDISHEWLKNLHQILNQRIVQQSSSRLVDFSATIYLEDGLKRTLNTYDAFSSYFETKGLVSTGIKIVWVYLVHFPERDLPEKQQITFSAITKNDKNNYRGQSTASSLSAMLKRNLSKPSLGEIDYQIDHTERTWGDDIETIISNHMASASRESPLVDIIYNLVRYGLCIALLIGVLIYLFRMEALADNSAKISEIHASYVNVKELPISLKNIGIKLDTLFEISVAEQESQAHRLKTLNSLVYLMLMPLLIPVFMILTVRKKFSFLTLTEQSKTNRTKLITREKRGGWILAFSALLSIVGSIVANFGYAWITS